MNHISWLLPDVFIPKKEFSGQVEVGKGMVKKMSNDNTNNFNNNNSSIVLYLMNKYKLTALQYHNTMRRKKKYNEPVLYVSINIFCIIQ